MSVYATAEARAFGRSPCIGLDRAGPEHVSRLERQTPQRVLGAALHARPHQRAALGAVGADARHIDERHLRIQSRQHFGSCQREVVGDARVLRFAHAGRRNAETEEARVEAAEVGLDRAVVHQIRARRRSRSFECVAPDAVRPTATTRSTSLASRHSRSTPLPTMPVAPKIIMFRGFTACTLYMSELHPCLTPLPSTPCRSPASIRCRRRRRARFRGTRTISTASASSMPAAMHHGAAAARSKPRRATSSA